MDKQNTNSCVVMNNTDLFSHIFSFLRNKAHLKCDNCDFTIQWDKSKPKKCDYVSTGKNITCFNCWKKGHDCWVC